MKITEFNKPTLRAMRSEIEKALAVLEGQFGIKVTLGSGSFTPSNVTYKFEMAVIGEGGQAETKYVADFKRLAHLYGLDPGDLGRRFICRGDEFIINGLRPSATKRPILAKGRGGKQFVFPATIVKAGLLGPKPTQAPKPGKRKFGLGEITDSQTITKNDVVSISGILGIPGVGSAKTPGAPSSGATKRVWEIADKFIENNDLNRANIIATCTAEGVNPSTAATQFGKWRKARGL